MIDRVALLSDLQSLLRSLEADLLARTESDEVPEVGAWLKAEYKTAKDAGRTAATYKVWLDDFITQVAAAWVLSSVFARFCEDNGLVDPPRISGPTGEGGEDRLRRARDEHELYFRDHLNETDREYLLDVFAGLAALPAGKDVFGPHNPMNALPNWLGPDAAGELLKFFQKIDSDTGTIVHDFTDSEWDTRFLGDLYQDLSEAARKKYALLQTPDFVEEFILDRTLEPALDEFGLTPDATLNESGSPRPASRAGGEGPSYFKMIDPACGSGHFLLGSFPRILLRWQKQEPGTNVRELVQRTLHSMHGVDINPFAIAIARFRLLLASLRACGITQLRDAPGFKMNLACGDSLYHGRQQQMMLDGIETDESHYFQSEDAEELKRILKEGTFHAVVANPPYIMTSDRAANKMYRSLYASCHLKYSMAIPFVERIFNLAIAPSSGKHGGGYNGQITANSFTKKEAGRKLVETFLPKVNLTHVIDSSLAHIESHGTPTVILLGRNGIPSSLPIRTAMGIKREDNEPANPAQGLVWTAICDQIDRVGSESEFLSVADIEREVLSQHPWALSGGGASDLSTVIGEAAYAEIGDEVESIGISAFTLLDDIFVLPQTTARRKRLPQKQIRLLIEGDSVRDWSQLALDAIVFPYDKSFKPFLDDETCRYLWLARTSLSNCKVFAGKTKVEAGAFWFEFGRLTKSKFKTPWSITFAEVATHNHFILDNGGKVFKKTAPIIKLPAGIDNLRHLELIGLLNSSVACFWMKQTLPSKGGGGIGGGIAAESWERFYEFRSNGLRAFPIVEASNVFRALLEDIDKQFKCESKMRPETRMVTNTSVAMRSRGWIESIHSGIRLQEDLDWECYRLYGLLEEDLTYQSNSLGIKLGERAFEIVMARKMAAGELTTTWFERHGSTPITELPGDWPDDYKTLVNRRIEVIGSDKNIGLIEQPEYKRRWNTESWDSQVERALRSWLLNRLESYFDFDGRMNDDGKPTAKFEIELTSVVKLADIAAKDAQFMEVGEVYKDDKAFNLQKLVEELVAAEHVPLLPVLRYKPNGLRNRVEWEKTWELQRKEDQMTAKVDAVAANLASHRAQFKTLKESLEAAAEADKPVIQKQVDSAQAEADSIAGNLATLTEQRDDFAKAIPVPPKYKSSEFISTGGARYWALRGKLDVPKERWVSFPHCESSDGTLTIAWAGHNHLQLAQSISAFYMDVLERQGGSEDPRLVPLLGCLIELQPWLKQWHHDLDPEYNQRMDEVFDGFTTEQLKTLGLTEAEVKAWEPPTKAKKRSRKKAGSS